MFYRLKKMYDSEIQGYNYAKTISQSKNTMKS